MAHTRRTERLKPPLRPIVILCPSINRRIGRRLGRRLTQPQHRSPLLHLLSKVDIIHRLIHRPMERLKLGSPSIIPRIRRLNNRLPLRSRMSNPSLCTIIAPPAIYPRVISRVGIAPKGDTGKRAPGSEHIRVRAHEQIRHHPPARHARYKNARRIGVVLLDSPADHADDPQRISAAIVRKSFLGG